MLRASFLYTLAAALVWAGPILAGDGVRIEPEDDGDFEYFDDFSTPRFLLDAFTSNLGPADWRAGKLLHRGPTPRRALTYRFHGSRLIKAFHLKIEQSSNGRNLGGRNDVHLSRNGLDWEQVASSRDLPADHNGNAVAPLAIDSADHGGLAGGTALWVRIDLVNDSGLPTSTSNMINSIRATFELGDAASDLDPQAGLRDAWGHLCRRNEWRGLLLDAADTPDTRAPCYFENADGWLERPGDDPHLVGETGDAFVIRRRASATQLTAASLRTYVKTKATDDDLMARLIVRATSDASRRMQVRWDGNTVAEHDVASYLSRHRALFVRLPGPHAAGTHELSVTAADDGFVRVSQILIAGPGDPRWADKPPPSPGGRLEVLSAYYMPDPAPPADSQVVEGRQKVEIGLSLDSLQRMHEEHADFGGLRVVLRNTGSAPVRIGHGLRLDGRPIEEHYVDFKTSAWDARGVVWYRVRPRTVAPGRCAQLYVRFRRRPEGRSVSMTIPVEGQKPIGVDVPFEDPGFTIDYVATGPAHDTLHVYLRRHDPAIATQEPGLALDGADLPGANLYGSRFPGNVALFVAPLDEPLAPGAFHVVGVRVGAGRTVAAQFRVMRHFFPRTTIHTPMKRARDLHMNLAMWQPHSLEVCNRHDIDTTGSEHPGAAHERVRYILGPDEPDAHDNRGGGHHRGLGYHARRLARNGWQTRIEHGTPHAASWIISNGTTRPLNWGVYGQVADVVCFDPYPLTFYPGDHAMVRESLNHTRLCGAPRPLFACLEAFGYEPGPGVPKQTKRGPLPAEWRQNVTQAIGAGMKGLTSWVWTDAAGGFSLSEPMQKEVTAVNRLLEHIEDDLLRGTPIDLATSDAGTVMTGTYDNERWPKDRVWVGALLSGPDTLVIAAANHIPAERELTKVEATENVTITVQLPDFLSQVEAFEVTAHGVNPFDIEHADGKALIHLDRIESGRVFILRRSSRPDP